tara:strand:- start:2660 stop:3217 length:558 start_codon:yes stop_codon:yes gene_type:complete
MDLFEIRGGKVFPTVHAIMVKPYKDIWERDEEEDKPRAMQELAYIELMMSFKKTNPYKGYTKEDRRAKLEMDLGICATTLEEDPLIAKALEHYEELRTEASPTISYYLAARQGADKMKKWLMDFDMSDVNPKTLAPMLKPREVTSALKDTFDVMKTLDGLRTKVNEEIYDATKTRGNKEINPLEE